MTTFSARRSPRRAVAALALVAIATSATLAACGDNTKSGGPGSSAGAKSTSPSAPSSADPRAGWTVAKRGNGEFQLPPGWTVLPSRAGLGLEAPKGNHLAKPGVGTFVSNTTARANTNADVPSRIAVLKGMGATKIKRLPDETFGGVVFYHIQAQTTDRWIDQFGTVRNGYLVNVAWDFIRAFINRADATKLINQVMTTFKPL